MTQLKIIVICCGLFFATYIRSSCAEIKCGKYERNVSCAVDCNEDFCPKCADDTATCDLPQNCNKPGCKCIFNYRRDENYKCIPTRDCPPFDCPDNEEFNPCPPYCPSDDCSQSSPSGGCPRRFGRIGIVLHCTPKCRCIKGYWRLNGICVPYAECPNAEINDEETSSE